MRMVQQCLGINQLRLNKSSPRLQHSSLAAPSINGHDNLEICGVSPITKLTAADTLHERNHHGGFDVSRLDYSNVIEDHDISSQYEIVGLNNTI